MIASVAGRVAAVGPEQAVIEVGGVGIAVQCTPSTLATLRVGATARLATSLVVREDSLTLHGFLDDDERTVFELVQTASGVGPRLAQAMLAVHGPDDLRRAVATEDLAALTAVPGIGRKGAQRIVLELRDRLGAPTGRPLDLRAAATAPHEPGWRPQVVGALVSLGWPVRDAEAAADTVAPGPTDGAVDGDGDGAPAPPDVPQLLRAALRTLART